MNRLLVEVQKLRLFVLENVLYQSAKKSFKMSSLVYYQKVMKRNVQLQNLAYRGFTEAVRQSAHIQCLKPSTRASTNTTRRAEMNHLQAVANDLAKIYMKSRYDEAKMRYSLGS